MPAENEGSFTIHPTTLESMFQALYATIAEDRAPRIRQAAVPASFDHISISAQLPSEPNDKFYGYCMLKSASDSEIVADIYMSDKPPDEPKIQVNGIRYQVLPDIGPAEPCKSAPTVECGQSVWMPDIHQSGEQNLERYLSGANPFTTLEGNALKVVDLIAHKNPELSILQLGGNLDLTTQLLSVLAPDKFGNERFSNFVVADTTSSTYEEFNKTFHDRSSKLRCIKLNEDLGLQGQTVQPESFDIIITAASFDSSRQKVGFFQDVSGLLQKGGIFLVLESFQEHQKGNGWKKAVTQSGLLPLCLFPTASIDTEGLKSALCVAAKPQNKRNADDMEMVYIVEPPQASSKARDIGQAVLQNLSRSARPSRVVSWPPDLSELKGRPVVSLMEFDTLILDHISAHDFGLMEKLVQESSSFLWVARGNEATTTAGMGFLEALGKAFQDLKWRFLLLEDKAARDVNELAAIITNIGVHSTPDKCFLEIDGQLCVSRWSQDRGFSRTIGNQGATATDVVPLGEPPASLKLVVNGLGDHQSVYFAADSEMEDGLAGFGEVEIVTKAVSLSPPDLAQSPLQPTVKGFSGVVRSVGKDCSRIKSGDRVYACQKGHFQSLYKVKERFCERIPKDGTFEEAANWSIAFGAAYQSLIRLADLQYGQSVLVQAASSAVGRAALQIAQSQLAVVFATARTPQERRIVEAHGIPPERILNDADLDLPSTLGRLTDGRGFDVILSNTDLGGELEELWRRVAPFGHLVSTAAPSSSSGGRGLDVAPFQKGCSFAVVDMNVIVCENPSMAAEIFKGVGEFLKKWPGRPKNLAPVFSSAQVADAVRFVQKQDGRTGFVSLTLDSHDQIPVLASARDPLRLRRESTYVLMGFSGGLSQSMAELLVEHGARNLVFLSRPGPKCAEEQPPNGKPRSRGVAVREYICNISDEAALRKVLDQCSKDMPPIRGVVQITGDLHDPSDGKMTYDLWQQCLYPGMLGSWLLHKWLPQDMDFFVMLDSTSRCTSKPPSRNCTRGNIFQEALARQRRGQGLHAVAVVVQQAGPHMRPIDQADSLATPGERGMAGLSEPQFRAIMKAAMLGTYGQGNAMPAQLVVSVVSGDGPHHEQNGPSTASNGPRLESLTKTHRGQSVNWWASEDLGKNDLEARLRQCKTLPEASKMIEETICEFLARRLTMTASDMDTHRPLSSYGVDSQMAAEMRALVKQRVQADIGLFEFLAGGHISALAVKIAESSQVVHPGVQSMYARAELT